MEKNAIFNDYQKRCNNSTSESLREKLKSMIAEIADDEIKVYVISTFSKSFSIFWTPSPDPSEIDSNRIAASVLKAFAKANQDWILDYYVYYRKREKKQSDDDPQLVRVDVFCFPKEITSNGTNEKEPSLLSILDAARKEDETIYQKFFSCANVDAAITPKKTNASK